VSDKSRKRVPRLGRGLSSLMSAPVAVPIAEPEAVVEPAAHGAVVPESSAATAVEALPASSEPISPGGGLRYLPIDALSPNPYQPRQRFDDQTIAQLAASIKADGVMQPIVARPVGSGAFQIIAGERRWRAARAAGLDRIPAVVRDLDDRQAAEWSLIENLQREDLNPIDKAEAFKQLCDAHSLSHDQVAQRVGLERSTISNLLRLLGLSESVRDLVRQDLLSMGQARAVASLNDSKAQEALAARAVREGLSVRAVEQLARQLAGGGAAASPSPSSVGPTPARPAYLRDLEKQLAEQLGTRVHLAPGRKKGQGRLTIEFYSLDQFDAIVSKLGATVS